MIWQDSCHFLIFDLKGRVVHGKADYQKYPEGVGPME